MPRTNMSRVSLSEFKAIKAKALERKAKRRAKAKQLKTFKPTRKGLVKKLDEVFSEWIRIKTRRQFGPMCPFCGKKPIEQCFHFITRAKHIVRWDEDNAIGSCRGCNFYNEQNPAPFLNFYLNKFGSEAWDRLFRKSNNIAKFDRSRLQEIYTGIKSKLETK